MFLSMDFGHVESLLLSLVHRPETLPCMPLPLANAQIFAGNPGRVKSNLFMYFIVA